MLNLNLLSYLQFLIAGILLYFIYFSIKIKKNRLALIFSIMTFLAFQFTIGYGIELLAKTENLGLLAVKYQYHGLSFLPIFWFIFAYKFHYNKYPSSQIIILVSTIPFITYFLVMTNELHYLYYKSFNMVSYNRNFLFKTEKNYFYYLFIGYTYFITLYGTFSFYGVWRRNSGELKLQSKLMLIGTIWAPSTNIVYLFKLTPSNFDPTSLGFLLMTYFFYKAIFEYDYLDLQEIVRYSVFDRINEGIIVIDKNMKIIDINTTTSIIFPYLNSNSIGNYITNYEIGKNILNNKNEDSFDIAVKTDDIEKFFVFRKNRIVFNKKYLGCIYIFQDSTHQHELINNLSYMATHDYLTGIYNRMNFLEIAQLEMNKLERYGGTMSLFMIDIDFFKKVNDTYGHTAGDEVLKVLTNSIKKRLRNSDIFARYGGEEFVILLFNTSYKDTLSISEQLRYLVENLEIIIDEKIIKITISIGLVYYDNLNVHLNLTQLINLSDTALYEAKSHGRNKVFVSNYNSKNQKLNLDTK